MALLPWAAITIYLMIGWRTRTEVPFVELWRGPEQASQAKRSLHRTPKWIALMLLAGAVAIVAASGPAVIRAGGANLDPADVLHATIETLAVRGGQCMIRVRNDSVTTTMQLLIETDHGNATQPINLPQAGQTRDYFVDVDLQANRIRATVDGNSVEVVRQRSWPKVIAAGELPADVRRVIDVYTVRRPSSAESAKVSVAMNRSAIAADEPAVFVSPADRPTPRTLQLAAHPVTQNVSVGELPDLAASADVPQGFSPIVTVADKPIVAVRDSPVRQAWVGFSSPSFSASPAFVILWTNLLDYVGHGGDEFVPARLPSLAESTILRAKSGANAVVSIGPWLACLAAGLSVIAAAMIKRPLP